MMSVQILWKSADSNSKQLQIAWSLVHHPTEVMSESRPETSDVTSNSLSCRRIRFGEVYTHQLPVPDRLVFSRVSQTLSQNQENSSGKIRLDLSLPLLSLLTLLLVI